MIGISKLYCGTVEPSDVLRYGRKSAALPSHLLQFSEDKKPVVVWNVTRACNLSCLHCYASATAGRAADELDPSEASGLVRSLNGYGVPVILFSGGEPLMRPDVFSLIESAVRGGSRAVLSTNGLLLTPESASRLAGIGLSYVGISLDGLEECHDAMRGVPGAFRGAVAAVETAQKAGLKVGLRLTLTRSNLADIDGIFDLMEKRAIPRVCFYHLVDTGAGPRLAAETLSHAETRAAISKICDRTRDMFARGLSPEVLTVDNQADGPYICMKMKAEGRAEDAAKALELLKLNGGSSSGHGIGCVSWNGDVHPDQFWRSVTLGNVREKPFPAVWNDPSNALLAKLRDKKANLKGRCRDCGYLAVCGGGLRARAAHATGDFWAPDPACYLTDAEIGLQGQGAPLAAGV
ncbi:MAG: radical SAM protein [Deltaproteobacteria bacterium]|jgi:radical SAM protein with 4Fe4S-binding SPASM domain|nr:radical SAM protein [Deltaproteobacteria bacterium]